MMGQCVVRALVNQSVSGSAGLRESWRWARLGGPPSVLLKSLFEFGVGLQNESDF